MLLYWENLFNMRHTSSKRLILGYLTLLVGSVVLFSSMLKKEYINPVGARNYALFFGANDYKSLVKLQHPVNDVKKVANELKDYYDFNTQVVENPTLDTIVARLNLYREKFASKEYDPSGQLLIFFSGHGEVENNNGFFLPIDADPKSIYNTGLAYGYWREFINSINCKHILLVIDACYSGTFDPEWDFRSGGSRFDRPGEKSRGEKLLIEHTKHTTRAFFTSATDVKTPDRSNFAKNFLAGLQHRGDLVDDQILTSSELWGFINNETPLPHLGNFGDADPQSSFLFILNTANYSETLYRPPSEIKKDLLIDNRDGKQYAIRQIGQKLWMTENLGFDIGLGAWCYEDNSANCSTYGRLYTWDAARRSCEGLGDKWRLANDEDWIDLLSAANETTYDDLVGGGTLQFNMTFGGIRLTNKSYKFKDKTGNYWSGTEKDKAHASYYYISRSNAKVFSFYNRKEEARSCRCVKDIKKKS